MRDSDLLKNLGVLLQFFQVIRVILDESVFRGLPKIVLLRKLNRRQNLTQRLIILIKMLINRPDVEMRNRQLQTLQNYPKNLPYQSIILPCPESSSFSIEPTHLKSASKPTSRKTNFFSIYHYITIIYSFNL